MELFSLLENDFPLKLCFTCLHWNNTGEQRITASIETHRESQMKCIEGTNLQKYCHARPARGQDLCILTILPHRGATDFELFISILAVIPQL